MIPQHSNWFGWWLWLDERQLEALDDTLSSGTHVRLNGVPGLGHLAVVAVQLDGRVHLLLHPIVDLEPKHVAQNARRYHDDEQDDQDDKVRQEHALDFLVGPEGAQEGDDGDDASGDDQNGRRGHIQVSSEQSFHERAIVECPHADGEDDDAAHLVGLGADEGLGCQSACEGHNYKRQV